MAPFDLLARVPGLAMLRAPARFALLVMLAVAALSAHGTAVLVRRWGWRGAAVASALAVAFLAESFVVDFPAGKPKPSPVPEVYHQLTTYPPEPVLSLPIYRATPEAFREADYLLFSTAHWRPIANGFGRHEPAAHKNNMLALSRFPDPDAIARLRELNIRYVILHTGRASELRAAASAADGNADVEALGQFGEDYLYRVR